MISESIQEHILYDKIYQYLWKKADAQQPPAILIPETVIFIRSMPVYWYYSDRQTHEIKKKKRENILKNNIKETWLKNPIKNGVVAYLLHFVENFTLIGKQPPIKQTNQIQIAYLDEFSFCAFFENESLELPFGILQKFIDPGDDLNSSIQAIWSRSITLFTKRTSKKPLYFKKLNCYERCCTFDGPEYLSEPTQVKDFQSQRISEQINKMISHLDAIAYGTFYFKVDKSANCYFLFCGNLSFEGDKLKTHHFDYDNCQTIQIPKTVDHIISVYKSRPAILDKDQKCIVCSRFEKGCNFREIPYNFLIDAKENDRKITLENEWPEEILDNAMTIKSTEREKKYLNNVTQVPLALGRMHQKLNQKTYEYYKNSEEFQNKKLQVCITCYLELAEIQQELCLKKIRDRNEYVAYMEIFKEQPKLKRPRVQFLRTRMEEQKKKQLQNELETIQQSHRSHRSEMTIKQYITMKSARQNLSSQEQIKSLVSYINTQKTDDQTRSKLGSSSRDQHSRKAKSELISSGNYSSQKKQNLREIISNPQIYQISPYLLSMKK